MTESVLWGAGPLKQPFSCWAQLSPQLKLTFVARTIEISRKAEEIFQFHEVTSTDPQSLRSKEGHRGECMDFPGNGK